MLVDVNRLIEEILRVVQHANQNIAIQSLFSDDTAFMQTDRGQLEMILLNLCLSAAEAMASGGRLTVSCRQVLHTGCADTGGPCQDADDGMIEIIVADTAADTQRISPGRALPTLPAAQPPGYAARMSPASLHSAVQRLAGRIQIDAVPGQGTTWTLLFPITEATGPDKAAGPGQKPGRKSNGTILLVEDEPLILKYCREMIHSLGFETLTAADGTTAVQIYNECNQAIDLVMLDMMLPGKDGFSVLPLLKECNPDLKVIIISGSALDSRLNQILSNGGPHGYLKKPFTLDELSGEIDRVLACRAAGAVGP